MGKAAGVLHRETRVLLHDPPILHPVILRCSSQVMERLHRKAQKMW